MKLFTPQELEKAAKEAIPDSLLEIFFKDPHVKDFVRILLYMNIQSIAGLSEGTDQQAHFDYVLTMSWKGFYADNKNSIYISSTGRVDQ